MDPSGAPTGAALFSRRETGVREGEEQQPERSEQEEVDGPVVHPGLHQDTGAHGPDGGAGGESGVDERHEPPSGRLLQVDGGRVYAHVVEARGRVEHDERREQRGVAPGEGEARDPEPQHAPGEDQENLPAKPVGRPAQARHREDRGCRPDEKRGPERAGGEVQGAAQVRQQDGEHAPEEPEKTEGPKPYGQEPAGRATRPRSLPLSRRSGRPACSRRSCSPSP